MTTSISRQRDHNAPEPEHGSGSTKRTEAVNKLKVAAVTCSAVLIISAAGITLPADLDERMSCRGLSFLPPQEEGWFIISRDRDGIAMFKKGDDPDETYAAYVKILKMLFDAPPGLYVQFDLIQKYADERFEMINSEHITTNMIKGCEKYLSTRWDYGARKESGTPDPMIIKDFDLYCVHPHKAGYLSLTTYSHRFYPGNEDPDFKRKALDFIKHVSLEEF